MEQISRQALNSAACLAVSRNRGSSFVGVLRILKGFLFHHYTREISVEMVALLGLLAFSPGWCFRGTKQKGPGSLGALWKILISYTTKGNRQY